MVVLPLYCEALGICENICLPAPTNSEVPLWQPWQVEAFGSTGDFVIDESCNLNDAGTAPGVLAL
jgi:hypothetical protein